jgi:alkylglycerol monooxygenase
MDHHLLLALAIPLFLGLMGLEFYYARKKNKNFFQFAESIANINVGIAERLTDILTLLPFFYFFRYIHDHYALFHFKSGPLTWVLLFLLTDLIWYWYHRLAHEVNLLWAAHIVHHQSEDFNYTTSARITIFQASIRSLFWSFLPLLGFPPEMISTFLLIHGFYPFFIHTQTIGRLGWLEYFLVTPSHHRVHHASNPIYLDKNYGDVLIIWDKMFGTFQKEQETPVYGLTKPLKSHSFLWQHFHYPLELLLAVKKTKGWKNKGKLIFGSPALLNPSFREVLERYFLKRNMILLPTLAHRRYIVLQTALSLLGLFCLILFFKDFSWLATMFMSCFILLSLINTGAILEQRSWIFYLEFGRLAVLLLWLWAYLPDLTTGILLITVTTVLLVFFRPLEKKYKNLLFQQAVG